MPDVPNIIVPTPEAMETYARNHECFWLSPDRRSYSGKSHGDMLLEHKDLFGFTQKEIDYAMEPKIHPQEVQDRSLHLAELALERGWICILLNKLARAVPGMPMFVFWFYAETHDVYDRITAWLKLRGVKNGLIRLRTITMRSWDQPVQSLYTGAQFSKSGDKPTCQVCGTELSPDELFHKGKCPRCGNPLW